MNDAKIYGGKHQSDISSVLDDLKSGRGIGAQHKITQEQSTVALVFHKREQLRGEGRVELTLKDKSNSNRDLGKIEASLKI